MSYCTPSRPKDTVSAASLPSISSTRTTFTRCAIGFPSLPGRSLTFDSDLVPRGIAANNRASITRPTLRTSQPPPQPLPRSHLRRRVRPMTDDDFTGLRAMFVNCTLKRSPDLSHTQGLVDASAAIMRKHGVDVEVLRAVDHDIATGVYLDMTEHGWASDEWPRIHERIMSSHILVIAGPIWLGDNSSVTK